MSAPDVVVELARPPSDAVERLQAMVRQREILAPAFGRLAGTLDAFSVPGREAWAQEFLSSSCARCDR